MLEQQREDLSQFLGVGGQRGEVRSDVAEEETSPALCALPYGFSTTSEKSAQINDLSTQWFSHCCCLYSGWHGTRHQRHRLHGRLEQPLQILDGELDGVNDLQEVC